MNSYFIASQPGNKMIRQRALCHYLYPRTFDLTRHVCGLNPEDS